MATLYPVDGTPPITREPTHPTTGFTLDELYDALDCQMIEIVYLGDDGRFLVIDEEAKLRDRPRPLNFAATEIARPYLMRDDWISGPALLCTSGEVQ